MPIEVIGRAKVYDVIDIRDIAIELDLFHYRSYYRARDQTDFNIAVIGVVYVKINKSVLCVGLNGNIV